MATRKPTDTQQVDSLPGEAEMARVYRATAQDAPPASLDARILTEAQRAVATSKARGPFGGHWAIPLSTAAVVILSLGVVLLMTKQGALNHRAEREVPNEYTAAPASPDSVSAERAVTAPAVSPPLADTARSDERMVPAKAKRTAPEPDSRLVGLVESKPAASAPAEVMKKADAPPVAATLAVAPKLNERTAEERVTTARDVLHTKNNLAKEAGGMNVQADVIAVQTSGQPGAYQFNVGIRSPDKGCAQYADWWEVVSTDGKLLYRRVLLHSHVDEQPFTRTGGTVPIQADTLVLVRAHMNTGGYGGVAFKGSVKTGFKQDVLGAEFAAGLAKQAPLPDGCDF